MLAALQDLILHLREDNDELAVQLANYCVDMATMHPDDPLGSIADEISYTYYHNFNKPTL